MLPSDSVRSNTLASWFRIASYLEPNAYRIDQFSSRMTAAHIADYKWITAEGDKFLEDSSTNFLLLHIPAPHPDGIYDRRTGTFTTHGGSYIDNLALADRYLAHVEELLKQRGEWDSSAVIVMGDHSWRTRLLWMAAPNWTAEDQAASHGGQFDDRPAYIVKLPHQNAPAHIDTPYDAVNSRALLRGILNGSIRTPAELAAFAEDPAGDAPSDAPGPRPALLSASHVLQPPALPRFLQSGSNVSHATLRTP
jgi:hypothetical protein